MADGVNGLSQLIRVGKNQFVLKDLKMDFLKKQRCDIIKLTTISLDEHGLQIQSVYSQFATSLVR